MLLDNTDAHRYSLAEAYAVTSRANAGTRSRSVVGTWPKRQGMGFSRLGDVACSPLVQPRGA